MGELIEYENILVVRAASCELQVTLRVGASCKLICELQVDMRVTNNFAF